MQAVKYEFDTEFTADGEILRDPHGAPTRFAPADMERARKEGYGLGQRDALVEAERASTAALQALVNSAEAILKRLDHEARAMRSEAARVAFAAARKIAGDALDAYGLERSAAAIDAAMDALRHQPRLIVRIAARDSEALAPRLEALREIHAYEGAVLLRPDEALAHGAVSIDWAEGATSIDPNEIAERIEALINAALASDAHNKETTA